MAISWPDDISWVHLPLKEAFAIRTEYLTTAPKGNPISVPFHSKASAIRVPSIFETLQFGNI
jgi:hypothetical protein